MATSETVPIVCTVCKKAATAVCKDCAGDKNIADFVPTPTRYCSKTCQRKDWNSHKKSCQAIQAKVKLFSAGLLLQQAFLATRTEAFDLSIAKIETAQDGTIHFFDQPVQVGVRPMPSSLTSDTNVKNAVLSYGAGADVFTGSMCELCDRALEGYVSNVEEIDVRVFESRVKVSRRFARDTQTGTVEATHSVLRVTLKDGSAWVLDLAGAQHGQHKPVMSFAEYDRVNIARILDSRPFGTSAQSEVSIYKRHPGARLLVMQWKDNQDYQVDELAEWEHHNVTVKGLLEAKTDDSQQLKQQLIDHLATAAREYVKLTLHDPTSQARPIEVNSFGFGHSSNMTEEDKGRMERKKARKLAQMDPEARAVWDASMEMGLNFFMM